MSDMGDPKSEPQPEAMWRIIVSRGVLLMVGLTLAYGGLRLGYGLYRNMTDPTLNSDPAQRRNIPLILWAIAIGLTIFGMTAAVASLTTTARVQQLFERFNKPPATGDRAGESGT